MRQPPAELLWDTGIHLCARWIFNCYVIENGGSGQAFIVDPGMPSLAERALGVLRSCGLGPQNLALACATHAHEDHVGALPWLRDRIGTGVFLPAKARDYGQGERPRSPGLREILRIAPVFPTQPFDAGALLELALRHGQVGYSASPFVWPGLAPGYLEDGMPLPGAPGWQAIAAAGHTDDSMAYYHEASRTLLSGDAVLTWDGRAWFNPELVDAAKTRETEARLRALRVDYLLPGHGRPLRGKNLLQQAGAARPGV